VTRLGRKGRRIGCGFSPAPNRRRWPKDAGSRRQTALRAGTQRPDSACRTARFPRGGEPSTTAPAGLCLEREEYRDLERSCKAAGGDTIRRVRSVAKSRCRLSSDDQRKPSGASDDAGVVDGHPLGNLAVRTRRVWALRSSRRAVCRRLPASFGHRRRLGAGRNPQPIGAPSDLNLVTALAVRPSAVNIPIRRRQPGGDSERCDLHSR